MIAREPIGEWIQEQGLLAEPPWLPDLELPGLYPPEEGPWKLVNSYEGDRYSIAKFLFWRQILAFGVECGQSRKFTLEYKIGTSRERLREVSAKLKWSIGKLQQELGTKLNEKLTLTEESKSSHERVVPSDKDTGVMYVEWQLIKHYRIVTWSQRWFSKPKRHELSFEIAMSTFVPRTLGYEKPDC